MKRVVLLVALAVMLGGCSTKLAVTSGGPESKLEPGNKVYIALAADGRYSEKTYAGSGMRVSGYVAHALEPHIASSQINTQIEQMDALLQKATEANAKYLFVPVIAHWEPRVAAWSGIPTRVNIELTAYDVETGQQIATNSASVRGRIMTFVSQHAHELAEQAVKDLVKSFY